MHLPDWAPLVAIGMVAGFLVGLAIKGGGVAGFFGDLVVGGLGGLAGPKLFQFAGVQASSQLGLLLFAAIGGCALVGLFRIVSK
ncbi:MAG: GlsB/YeaQ/YmgE family stress response membrane protein [Verrucomicrobia bacterium]|nr:GlsB/YeaQ/YmgE family stress response membrane protein [Verrucomicrobiota bacterium]